MKLRMRALALVLMLCSFLAPVATAQDATPAATPMATPVAGPGLQAAVDWLIDQQQEDGSWLGFSGDPDAGVTIDAIISLAAAQEAGIDPGTSIDEALAWLETSDLTASYVDSGTGAAAKLVLALVAAGDEDLALGNIQPLGLIPAGQNAETGMYGGGLYDHSYAIMALVATDSEVPAEAIAFFETVQAENGGFAWDGSTDEAMVDSNTTAMVVQALVAAGEQDNPVVAEAIAYLRTVVTDAGAGYSVGGEADANSTALVAQAFLAVDEDATHLITSLSMFQSADGYYDWMLGSDSNPLFATLQAIPAVAELPLPIVPGITELENAA